MGLGRVGGLGLVGGRQGGWGGWATSWVSRQQVHAPGWGTIFNAFKFAMLHCYTICAQMLTPFIINFCSTGHGGQGGIGGGIGGGIVG